MERVIIARRKMTPLRQCCYREETMRPGLKTELLIDANIESYRSFFDFEWAKKLSLLTDGTPLEEHVFIFILNWRATANAQFMPWLMMHSIEHVETEYLRPKPTMMEWAMRAVIDMVDNLMEGELSKTKRKVMSKQIRDFLLPKIEEGRKNAQTFAHPEAKPENLFRMFVQNEGGVELVYAIFGAQRICYGNFFHEYENFVKRCVGLVKKKPEYRVGKWEILCTDVEAEFGKAIADFCLPSWSPWAATCWRGWVFGAPVAQAARGAPPARGRPSWSGLLRLRLVSVPVKAYPAVSSTTTNREKTIGDMGIIDRTRVQWVIQDGNEGI
jgi:hypothetical protein